MPAWYARPFLYYFIASALIMVGFFFLGKSEGMKVFASEGNEEHQQKIKSDYAGGVTAMVVGSVFILVAIVLWFMSGKAGDDVINFGSSF